MSESELPATMRAAVWTGRDQIEIQQLPRPDPDDGWTLVKTELTGLCGTDFSIVYGTHPRARPPQVLGHEITGTVAVAASTGPDAGTRVSVEPLIHCGRCRACRHGATHVCRRLRLYGIDRPGSLATYVALPADVLIPVASDVPIREVAFAEPLAVAVHAVHRSRLTPGDAVLVFGAGPIGTLTALVARHAGAGSVLISEPSPARAALAASLGFDIVDPGADPVQTIRDQTAGEGADVVFDAAAHPGVAAQLSAAARVHGQIVLVGVYKRPAALDLQGVAFAEQDLIGVRVYSRGDFLDAVALIEADTLGLGRLPTRVFDLADTAPAFEQAMSAGEILKVLVASDPDALAAPTPIGDR